MDKSIYYYFDELEKRYFYTLPFDIRLKVLSLTPECLQYLDLWEIVDCIKGGLF